MPWFKVDDSFHAHPKVLATDADALGLWVVAGAWSSSNLTDGFVPDHVLPRLLPDAANLAQKLITAGLWRKARGGYRFHDWDDYQPSASDVRAMREKRAAAGRMGGLASGRARATTRSTVNEDPFNAKQTRSKPEHDHAAPRQPQSRYQHEQPSKTASKPEALASPTVEPPTRPDPAFKGGHSQSASYDRANEPPPPQCQDHTNDPNPPPCGRCADARKARTRWDIADAERRHNAPKCRHHRGQPANNCALCRSEALAAREDA